MDMRKKGISALTFMDELPETVDMRPGPAEVLEMETDAAAVRAAVERLSPALRDAVILRYFDELPEAEIARALETTVGAVKVRLNTARRAESVGISGGRHHPIREEVLDVSSALKGRIRYGAVQFPLLRRGLRFREAGQMVQGQHGRRTLYRLPDGPVDADRRGLSTTAL